MQVSQVVGCLLIDSKTLKAGLMPVVAGTQADVRVVLAGLARTACRAALDALAARNDALAKRPPDLDGFMAYQSMHAVQSAERGAALAAVDQARPIPSGFVAAVAQCAASFSINVDTP